MKFKEAYETHHSEYGKFDLVENKLSSRPDLHAFMMIDRLVPGTSDIVGAAFHDEFFLDVSVDALDEIATESQMIDLIRCGVRFDRETDSLAMFT